MANKGDIRKEKIQPNFPKRWDVIPFKKGLMKSGKFTKLKSSQYLETGIYPIIDQGEKFISGYIDDKNLIYDGILPIVIFGDHTRNIKFIDFPFAAGADGTKILAPVEDINPQLFYYYLKTLKIPSFGYSRHYKVFDFLDLPIPPLPEQQRIVAKLDALFGHLDRMREKLDGIPELLKNFRQQVLTQAVTGELVNAKMEIRLLGDYLDDIKYGTSKKSEYKLEGIPILRIPNIDVEKGKISISDLKYSILEDKEYEKLKLKEGDILIIRSNGSVSLVGQSAIIQEEEIDFAYAGYLVRLRTKDALEPKFLNYILKSNFLRGQIVETARSTSGVNNINTTEIKSLKIPITSIVDQKKIIDRIDLFFELANKIEVQYQSLKAKVDQLPQAILSKAFRGELVEQEVKAYVVEEGEGLMAAEETEEYRNHDKTI